MRRIPSPFTPCNIHHTHLHHPYFRLPFIGYPLTTYRLSLPSQGKSAFSWKSNWEEDSLEVLRQEVTNPQMPNTIMTTSNSYRLLLPKKGDEWNQGSHISSQQPLRVTGRTMNGTHCERAYAHAASSKACVIRYLYIAHLSGCLSVCLHPLRINTIVNEPHCCLP